MNQLTPLSYGAISPLRKSGPALLSFPADTSSSSLSSPPLSPEASASSERVWSRLFATSARMRRFNSLLRTELLQRWRAVLARLLRSLPSYPPEARALPHRFKTVRILYSRTM